MPMRYMHCAAGPCLACGGIHALRGGARALGCAMLLRLRRQVQGNVTLGNMHSCICIYYSRSLCLAVVVT